MAKKSSLKRARQELKRKMRNKRVKSTFKTAVKRLNFALNEKRDKEEIKDLFKRVVSSIDKASSKGVIHRNTAARKKSQIARKVNSYLM
ncbi:MAG TPA: 30S ribosomal protein S20 [Candidatus Omnitrophica bacterium]|nr:30S ribosomal protein S20 [Candidatus Omnitrophota bacterium]